MWLMWADSYARPQRSLIGLSWAVTGLIRVPRESVVDTHTQLEEQEQVVNGMIKDPVVNNIVNNEQGENQGEDKDEGVGEMDQPVNEERNPRGVGVGTSDGRQDIRRRRLVARGLMSEIGESEVNNLLTCAAGRSVKCETIRWITKAEGSLLLVVQMMSEKEVRDILAGKRKLKTTEEWKQVFLGKDRDWRERMKFRALLEEAWERAREEGGIVRVVGGVPSVYPRQRVPVRVTDGGKA